jgi:hypothetical protein
VTDGLRGTVFINWLDGDPHVWSSYWDSDEAGATAPLDEAEHATADAAVLWGRERAARVVVIGRDGQVYWAGTDPMPADVSGTWDAAPPQAR